MIRNQETELQMEEQTMFLQRFQSFCEKMNLFRQKNYEQNCRACLFLLLFTILVFVFVTFLIYYYSSVCICIFLETCVYICWNLCIVFVLQEDSGFRLDLDNGGRKWVWGSGGSGAGLWLPLGQDLMIISLVINGMITKSRPRLKTAPRPPPRRKVLIPALFT